MKKGFTLIEIIICIGLISIIGVGTTIVIFQNNSRKEIDELVKNKVDFDNALDIYLTNHDEIVNNINNNVEGAVISLEVLKNEGLIPSNLKIDYKDNYYIVSKALFSNTPLNDNVVKEECENSVTLSKIASWNEENNAENVLYFCSKKSEVDQLDLESQVCNDITYSKDTLAYRIICNAKKYANVIEKVDDNAICLSGNSTACEELKKSVESYFNHYTIYDENAEKQTRRDSLYDVYLTAFLSKEEDDGGYSYYYRDRPNDNYLTFAGMCWRIYRIDGYGNIKLILHDKDNECNSSSTQSNRSLGRGNYGYKINNNGSRLYLYDYLNPEEEKELAMSNIYKNFQNTLDINIKNAYGNSKELSSYLVQGNWCIDNRYQSNISEEDAQKNRREGREIRSLKSFADYTPTFKCAVEKTNNFSDGTTMYVAGVTYDEVAIGKSIFALKGGEDFWTLNISYTDCSAGRYCSYSYYEQQYAFIMRAYYSLYSSNYFVGTAEFKITDKFPIVPVIQLQSGIKIESGTGLLNDPYIIKTN